MSGLRAVERCDALGSGRFSDSPDFLFRPYLGPAHRATVEQVTDWMKEAGMSVRLDPAGTLIGRYEGAGPRTLLIASHIDSVKDAGRYDGPLGVMLGIECAAALHKAGRRLPFAIEVAAFGDEEGSRFPAAMLTSRAMAGRLEAKTLEIAGLDEALAAWKLDRASYLTARRDPAELIGYLEAHIEQGPVLEAEGVALGIVTAIAAQKRYAVTVTGTAGHAGTNSMGLRKDALTAAAEMVLAIEETGRAGPPDLVATVGRMEVLPGAPNVVPGEVRFTIDVRAGTADVRNHAAEEIWQAVRDIAELRGVGLGFRQSHDLPPAPCAPEMMARLEKAIISIGQPVRRLVSGAGHDAMMFADIIPTAMLFLRCKGGISHNPAESVSAEDTDLALRALLAFLDTLAEDFDG
jgi:allantoate deiminase